MFKKLAIYWILGSVWLVYGFHYHVWGKLQGILKGVVSCKILLSGSQFALLKSLLLHSLYD